MLSDDITGGISKGIGAITAVIGGAIRGALIGAGLVIAGAALAGAFTGMMVATGGFGAVMMGGLCGLAAGAGSVLSTATGGIALVETGAAIGAAVLGVSSIIPGAGEWFGFKGLLKPSARGERSPEVIIDRSPNRSVTLADNPYYVPDRGAQMMQKGDEAHVCIHR